MGEASSSFSQKPPLIAPLMLPKPCHAKPQQETHSQCSMATLLLKIPLQARSVSWCWWGKSIWNQLKGWLF